jgi:putative glutamine amidotransferase
MRMTSIKRSANQIHPRKAPLVGLVLQLSRRAARPDQFGHHVAYFSALQEVRLFPVGIPPLSPHLLEPAYLNLDGILLAGGPDVAPDRYSETVSFHLDGPDEMLDEAELQLAEWCLRDGKPILGICRGLQLLNVAVGGTLYQDISEQTRTPVDHRFSQPVSRRSLTAHQLDLNPTHWLSQSISQATVAVNSMHHQGIKGLGDGLEAFGWAPDGLIEAAQIVDHPFAVGFQGHLEEIIGVQGWARFIFERFASAVSEWETVGSVRV